MTTSMTLPPADRASWAHYVAWARRDLKNYATITISSGLVIRVSEHLDRVESGLEFYRGLRTAATTEGETE